MGGLKCNSRELRGGELVVEGVWNDASASMRGVDWEISGLVCNRQILTECNAVHWPSTGHCAILGSQKMLCYRFYLYSPGRMSPVILYTWSEYTME